MALRDGTRPSGIPIVTLSVLAICAITLVGVILPLAGITSDFGGMGWILLGCLTLVTVVILLQLRFLIMPSMVKGFRDQTKQATFAEFEQTFRLVPSMYAIAPSIYGLVAGILNAAWWPALPFGAMALVTLAVTHGYAQQQLEALRREARTRGEA